MQHLLINKMLLSATSALFFLGVIAANSPEVHADITTEMNSYKHHIEITIPDNNQDKIYHVNGKTFYWKDLNKAQQSRVTAVEHKLKAVERSFQYQENELANFARQLDDKALEIENEVDKISRIRENFDKDSLNTSELHRFASEMIKLSAINEAILKQKEQEMHQIEQQLNAVDFSLINDIENHAKALEQVLLEIAEQI